MVSVRWLGRRAGLLLVVALVLSAPAASWGQDVKRPGGRFRPPSPQEFMEGMIKSASEYYGLEEAQQEALKALLEERGKLMHDKQQAIGEHFRTYREKAEAGESVDWEKARADAAPLFEEIRKFMEETRTEFRDKILSDEQKKKFDDAKEKGLDTLSGRENRFGQGGPFGRPDANEQLTRRFTGKGFEEQNWQSWLDRLARSASLSQEQTAQAKVMLELAKEAAADYRKGREDDYKKLAAEWGEIVKNPQADAAKKAAIQKAGEELTAPIEEIGKKWKADVIGTLNDEQKKVAEELDRRGGFGRGPPGGTGRRPGEGERKSQE